MVVFFQKNLAYQTEKPTLSEMNLLYLIIVTTAFEWTVCIIFSVRSGMLETNKFGEDLSYFVILQYKLRDFIKISDDLSMTQ